MAITIIVSIIFLSIIGGILGFLCYKLLKKHLISILIVICTTYLGTIPIYMVTPIVYLCIPLGIVVYFYLISDLKS